MASSFLPYGRQTIDDDDIAAVVSVLQSDSLTTGPAVDTFEASLSHQMAGADVIACSNGTTALHLAAVALGLGHGDWVVVPAITFVATANAVRYTGADVIFCDVDPKTGLMTRETLERAIALNEDKNIRAVFPVHLAGQPADPVAIASFARQQGLSIIEDACHALGTTYADETSNEQIPVGACAHSDMAVFSFHPVKTIACGEGGAVSTTNPQLAKRLRSLRSHGMTRTPEEFQNRDMAFDENGVTNRWYYEMAEPGFNYRLSDINAALGASQMRKLDKFVKARQQTVAHYDQMFDNLGLNVAPINKVPGCRVGWHLYPVLIDFDKIGISRSALMKALADRGIGTQVHYIPVPSQPYYQSLYGQQSFRGALAYYHSTLSLPLFPAVMEDEAAFVANSIADIVQH